jgi:hypothetical protein
MYQDMRHRHASGSFVTIVPPSTTPPQLAAALEVQPLTQSVNQLTRMQAIGVAAPAVIRCKKYLNMYLADIPEATLL